MGKGLSIGSPPGKRNPVCLRRAAHAKVRQDLADSKRLRRLCGATFGWSGARVVAIDRPYRGPTRSHRAIAQFRGGRHIRSFAAAKRILPNKLQRPKGYFRSA